MATNACNVCGNAINECECAKPLSFEDMVRARDIVREEMKGTRPCVMLVDGVPHTIVGSRSGGGGGPREYTDAELAEMPRVMLIHVVGGVEIIKLK